MTTTTLDVRAMRALAIHYLINANNAAGLGRTVGSGDAALDNVEGNLRLTSCDIVANLTRPDTSLRFDLFGEGFHFGFTLAALIAGSPLNLDPNAVAALVAEIDANLDRANARETH